MPPPESAPEVDLNDPTLLTRLERLYIEIPGLEDDFLYEIVKILKARSSITRGEFNELCHRVSLRPESLIEWDDEYFEQTFDEIVRIARERRSARGTPN